MTVTITLAALLVPYALVVVFVATFAYFNIQHLVHYGATTRLSYAVTMSFLIGAAFILLLTWQQLGGTDWNQSLSLTPALPSFGPPAAANLNQP